MPLRAIPAAINPGLNSGLSRRLRRRLVIFQAPRNRRRLKMRSDCPCNTGLPTICSMIATAAVATLSSANGAFAQETAQGLLAIQVRSQGQVCDNPISATRKNIQPRTYRFGLFDAR